MSTNADVFEPIIPAPKKIAVLIWVHNNDSSGNGDDNGNDINSFNNCHFRVTSHGHTL